MKTKSGDLLINNRIAWGKAYLKQAGMISQPARAVVKITNKGKEILKKGSLSLRELLLDSEFQANRQTSKESNSQEEIVGDESPQDLIDRGFRYIESQVKTELLSKLRQTDPYYFEKIVLKLLNKMGYGSFTETTKSNDGGYRWYY